MRDPELCAVGWRAALQHRGPEAGSPSRQWQRLDRLSRLLSKLSQCWAFPSPGAYCSRHPFFRPLLSQLFLSLVPNHRTPAPASVCLLAYTDTFSHSAQETQTRLAPIRPATCLNSASRHGSSALGCLRLAQSRHGVFWSPFLHSMPRVSPLKTPWFNTTQGHPLDVHRTESQSVPRAHGPDFACLLLTAGWAL